MSDDFTPFPLGRENPCPPLSDIASAIPVNEFKFTVKKNHYKEGSFRLDTQETKVARKVKRKFHPHYIHSYRLSRDNK